MNVQEFSSVAREWIEAISAVLEIFLVKVGIIIGACYGLRKLIKRNEAELRQKLGEIEKRQDRQGERIDKVALAVNPETTSQPKEPPIQ